MNIKEYKQLTHVHLKDWRVLTTEKSPEMIYAWINEHSHIMIDGEMHSKFSIENAVRASFDDVESLIQSQSKEIQDKMRTKQKWLKSEMWKEMTLDYAKNYLEKLLAN